MLGARVFRVFISSTFTDTVKERDVLQDCVFGELRTYCASMGYGFQAVDLRWGIGEEASSGQRTMRICLSEIARCQEISPRPNFVVLLGDRYGWRPLPEVVDAEEFDAVVVKLSDADARAAETVYYRDDNAVPPEYVLAPVKGDASYDAAALRVALAQAAEAAGLDEATSAKYRLSATEQEIAEGALLAPHAEDHVFCFDRTIEGLSVEAAAYRDLNPDGSQDAEAAAMLADLKRRLKERLGEASNGGNVYDYSATWENDAPSTTHIAQMCADMLAALKHIIDDEIERLGKLSHLEQEQVAHRLFAEERSECFVGRTEYLDRIADYLAGGDDHPLCIFSEGGLGKSALVAAVATRAATRHDDAVIVTRYIGATSASADPRSLLTDLCAEISEAYGSTEPVPSTLQELQQELPKRLELATAHRPLIVFLDSLDQLAAGSGTNVSWLPSNLPASVRLVTTTRPGEYLGSLRGRLPAELVFELGSMPAEEGSQLLHDWLTAAGRTLREDQREDQRDAVLGRFGANGSPLYLRLAFEEAKLWPANKPAASLGDDVPSVIGGLYDRLESEHGAQLVGHALGFLGCTYERLGLSEDEMLEALATDDDVWREFTARSHWAMPVRRLPVVVWSRLYFDLAPYLSPRASEGASLMSFFHRELAEVAVARYVVGRESHTHDVLADVMLSLARGKGAVERKWKGSNHALAELPYHLTGAERWDDVFATLTDFTYLEEKAKRVAVVSAKDAQGNDATVYNGVLALIDDYDRALAAFPTE
jgi:NACHT domain- and WD repeat-containing protein